MMKFKCGPVSLALVQSNDTLYKISTGGANPALVASIKRYGLICPPILTEVSKGYRIVSGFKRIAACRQLGLEYIHAHFLDPPISREILIEIAITENANQRSLNLIEQSNAIEILFAYHQDDARVLASASAAGIPINIDMVRKLRVLAEADPTIKKGVLEGSISLPVALQLSTMKDQDGAVALAMLLTELGLSLNRQREMLEWVISICRRDAITILQLLNENEVSQCLLDKQLDHRQKVATVRDYLRRRRYPFIVEYEQRFVKNRNRLKLPAGTQLIAPLHFESSTLCLKIDFRSQTELISKLKDIEMLSTSDLMKNLWMDDPTTHSS